MNFKELSVIGFGSQGSAWAQNARDSGWKVQVFLYAEGKSWLKAQELGFTPKLLAQHPLPSEGWMALMIPDAEIASFVSKSVSKSISESSARRWVLAHGFAAVGGELERDLRSGDSVFLLAPKSIGPELRAKYVAGKGQHDLRAASFVRDPAHQKEFETLAQALGFKPGALIPSTFEEEAKADWMSEQGVLCGGLFTVLLWTLEEMERQGVSRALQKEECLTELSLVANVLKERGLEATFGLISDAAKVGTLEMNLFLEKQGLKESFQKQLRLGSSQAFRDRVTEGKWKDGVAELRSRLKELDPHARS